MTLIYIGILDLASYSKATVLLIDSWPMSVCLYSKNVRTMLVFLFLAFLITFVIVSAFVSASPLNYGKFGLAVVMVNCQVLTNSLNSALLKGLLSATTVPSIKH